jgi:hypothetical protein
VNDITIAEENIINLITSHAVLLHDVTGLPAVPTIQVIAGTVHEALVIRFLRVETIVMIYISCQTVSASHDHLAWGFGTCHT